MYGDPTLRLMGLMGEQKKSPNITVVVKSHALEYPSHINHKLSRFDAVIHLVRNPFDALVAERKRLLHFTHSHTAQPSWNRFANGRAMSGDGGFQSATLPWDLWMDQYAQRWKGTVGIATGYYVGYAKLPLLELRYEDLRSNATRQLERALAFLGTVPSPCHCAFPFPLLTLLHRRSNRVGARLVGVPHNRVEIVLILAIS